MVDFFKEEVIRNEFTESLNKKLKIDKTSAAGIANRFDGRKYFIIGQLKIWLKKIRPYGQKVLEFHEDNDLYWLRNYPIHKWTKAYLQLIEDPNGNIL